MVGWERVDDGTLLLAVRPRRWQRSLRSFGCLLTVALSLTVAHQVGGLIGERTWPWLGTLAAILAFVLAGPIFGVLVVPLGQAGRRAPWRELLRRTGQEPLWRTVRRTRQDLMGIERGQRGWVLLIRGALPAQGTIFQLRLDLRTDEEGAGQWELVRGPRLDPWGAALHSLDAWDRTLGPVPAGEIVPLLEAIQRLSRRRGLTEGRGTRFQADLALLDAAVPQRIWRRSVRGGSTPEDGPGMEVVRRALAAAGWSPLAERPPT